MRIGIDTGGTFTDAVVVDSGSGGPRLGMGKSLSTPGDLTSGALAAFEAAANDLGQPLAEVLERADSIGYATTVGLNALLTGTGAPIATEGNDFNSGILTAAGEVALAGPYVLVHAAALGQIEANRVVARRLNGLCDRYGTDTVVAVIDGLIDRTEAAVRARLASLPDGRWRHRGLVEHDVAEGLVTEAGAARDYGVVVGDAAATEALRAQRRRERIGRAPAPPVEETPAGRRLSSSVVLAEGHYLCRHCGHNHGPTTEPLVSLLVLARSPVDDRTPWPSARPGAERFETRRLFCPACAVQVDVQVALADAPLLETAELIDP